VMTVQLLSAFHAVQAQQHSCVMLFHALLQHPRSQRHCIALAEPLVRKCTMRPTMHTGFSLAYISFSVAQGPVNCRPHPLAPPKTSFEPPLSATSLSSHCCKLTNPAPPSFPLPTSFPHSLTE
jgi:hypothetical protein